MWNCWGHCTSKRERTEILIFFNAKVTLQKREGVTREDVHYFFKQFVIKRCTSCRSSSNNIAPRYPIRLSVNLGEAMSFRHSNWPKCAGYLKYSYRFISTWQSLMYFDNIVSRYKPQHMNIQQLGDVTTPPHTVFFSKCRADVRALLVHDCSLFRCCSCGSYLSNQIPQPCRRRHPNCWDFQSVKKSSV